MALVSVKFGIKKHSCRFSGWMPSGLGQNRNSCGQHTLTCIVGTATVQISTGWELISTENSFSQLVGVDLPLSCLHEHELPSCLWDKFNHAFNRKLASGVPGLSASFKLSRKLLMSHILVQKNYRHIKFQYLTTSWFSMCLWNSC